MVLLEMRLLFRLIRFIYQKIIRLYEKGYNSPFLKAVRYFVDSPYDEIYLRGIRAQGRYKSELRAEVFESAIK